MLGAQTLSTSHKKSKEQKLLAWMRVAVTMVELFQMAEVFRVRRNRVTQPLEKLR